jgi:hypothetical protein
MRNILLLLFFLIPESYAMTDVNCFIKDINGTVLSIENVENSFTTLGSLEPHNEEFTFYGNWGFKNYFFEMYLAVYLEERGILLMNKLTEEIDPAKPFTKIMGSGFTLYSPPDLAHEYFFGCEGHYYPF